MTDLERALREMNSDLADQLDRVRGNCEDIWATPKFRWFPDHGPEHSRRVIRNVEEIIKPLLMRADFPFSEQELFVLLASCYLHDIGMQDWRLEGKFSGDAQFDYEGIRRRHPDRSAKLIKDGKINIKDAPVIFSFDHDYAEAIAQISRAHGSEFFSETVEEIIQYPLYPSNEQIRGPFLAALLLMADELDLHRTRVESCLRSEALNTESFPPLSLLHIYKHHYITKVRVEDNTTLERSIVIRFQVPEGWIEDLHQIQDWVTTTLRRQCNLTEDYLRPYGISWAQISVEHEPERIQRPLPEVARTKLHELTYRRKLINRDDLIDSLRTLLVYRDKPGYLIDVSSCLGGELEFIISWFIVASRAYPELTLKHIEFAPLESYSRADIQAITEDLLSSDDAGIAVFSYTNYTPTSLFAWLRNEWIPELIDNSGELGNSVVLFAEEEEDSQTAHMGGRAVHFRLDYYVRQDVANHLTSSFGCSPEIANTVVGSMDPDRLQPKHVIERLELLHEAGLL